MPEPVRLVIWDLDETFWKGTLSEGGIELIAAHCDLVQTLASRGIVSSICSKNDSAAVERVLTDAGIWQYFVLPSINWEPKGPRLQSLIESFQLRPASVLFIDDNHLQREEARFVLPELQVSDESIIGQMATSPLFAGKPDPQLERLRQYKMLEQRQADSRAAGSDTREFLHSCHITVAIEHDIVSHLPRAIELINRTNQLNFLKSRLPEDGAQAAQQLTALLSRHDIHAGLVRVADRYGDHGFCGIYIVQGAHKLLQFAFSCRILGMGVERWLYRRLGAPPLKIEGEVLANLADDSPVDWIRIASGATAAAERAGERLGWIYARGGCDLQAVCHYFNVGAFGASGEFNVHRHGTDARVDHSMFLRYAIAGLPPGALEACKAIGYRDEDFQTRLLEGKGRVGWLLSFWSDAAYALYRHKQTGILVPFMLPGRADHLRDATAASVEDLPPTHRQTWLADALEYLKQHFEFAGPITGATFKQNLNLTLDAAPPGAQIFILGANERLWDPKARTWHRSSFCQALNKWTHAEVKRRPNVTVLSIRDFITSESEVHEWTHFDRMVYFRVYREIERRMLGAYSESPGPLSPAAQTAELGAKG
jgi:FkbH-like protein